MSIEEIMALPEEESTNQPQSQDYYSYDEKLIKYHKWTDSGKPIDTKDIVIVKDIIDNNDIFVLAHKAYYYEKGYYRCDEKGIHMKSLIKSYIYAELVKVGRIDRINNLLLQEESLQVKYEDLNNHPKHWINFKNCMLDVKEMKILPHSPEYRSVNQVPHNWTGKEPDAGSVVKKYLNEFIPNDADRNMALEYFGYSLTTDTRFQKMMFLKGLPEIGKSVLLGLVEKTVGLENVVHIKIQNLNGRFSSIKLLGKMMDIYADVPATGMKDLSTVKMITGEDYCQGEYKFGDIISFKPYCKLLFSANTMPHAKDGSSGAFYRRLMILPLSTRASNIENINEALEEDIGSFIYLIVNAAHNLYVRGHFEESESSKEAVQELFKESDSALAFIEDKLIVSRSSKIEVGELYEAYESYCHTNDRNAESRNAFYASLRDKGYVEYRSNGSRYFRGLEIKHSAKLIEGISIDPETIDGDDGSYTISEAS